MLRKEFLNVAPNAHDLDDLSQITPFLFLSVKATFVKREWILLIPTKILAAYSTITFTGKSALIPLLLLHKKPMPKPFEFDRHLAPSHCRDHLARLNRQGRAGVEKFSLQEFRAPERKCPLDRLRSAGAGFGVNATSPYST